MQNRIDSLPKIGKMLATTEPAMFDLRKATKTDLIERAEYLESFPASGRYRDDLLAEASALRRLARDGNPYSIG